MWKSLHQSTDGVKIMIEGDINHFSNVLVHYDITPSEGWDSVCLLGSKSKQSWYRHLQVPLQVKTSNIMWWVRYVN